MSLLSDLPTRTVQCPTFKPISKRSVGPSSMQTKVGGQTTIIKVQINVSRAQVFGQV